MENTTETISLSPNLEPEKTPEPPLEPRREHRSLAAIAFSVVFILIGLIVFGSALGIVVSLWALILLIFGTSGVALLISALAEYRR
ncbi:MFS transporter [uncultured Mobiluncus sp.]|uniref:MFS transporter n=1 Tax=uncultured Mobiluncus sp. TaxID=293425 RepID=UPI00260640E7|nr:MFS transporter [uncultured Mobiluncus sp.]